MPEVNTSGTLSDAKTKVTTVTVNPPPPAPPETSTPPVGKPTLKLSNRPHKTRRWLVETAAKAMEDQGGTAVEVERFMDEAWKPGGYGAALVACTRWFEVE